MDVRSVRAFALALIIAACLATTTLSGQQVGENINVLPVVPPDASTDFYLKGDAYLQRQVEPTLAVSTRNPNHLAAFYIDYRTVDIANDVNVGGGASFVSNVWNVFKGWFAKLLGKPAAQALPVAASPAEANIGYSRSYDGGLTWSGALLPGLSFDTITSPIKDYGATTDPAAVAVPCGGIYLAFVAFNRDASGNIGNSAIVVAKFADLDNSTTGEHTIVYKGMSVLATSNNATNGPFNDKVAIAADIDRTRGGCAHRIYVTSTEFDGLDKQGKFQSKVLFFTNAFLDETSSLDGVTSWASREITGSFTQSQGTAIAVDPTNGDVYVFWRHFFKPHTIVFAKGSASAAASARLGKPVALFSDAMSTFDQPTVPITSGPENLAFRSNAFPTATVAVDDAGKSHVLVAWQERVTSSGVPAPLGTGSPRIVMTPSDNGGSSWTARKAVDMLQRPPEPAGLGFANDPLDGLPRPSYPQVMPSLAFGGGQLMLAYYEARGEVGPSGYITAYNRILDLRGALLDKATGALVKSFQVSRYPIKPWALSPRTSNTISDLEPVNPPCWPDFGNGFDPCVPRINRVVPQSKNGTVAFLGDYNWLASSVQFVPNGSGGWIWAIKATDVPWVGGHAIFADNRNVVPPLEPLTISEEWNRYPYYSPPGLLLPCQNAGSRNTDVLTSRLSLGLVVTAPLVWRPTPAEFPFTVWNNTSQKRFFRLNIETTALSAGFGKPGTAFENKRDGVIQVLPYSSSSHVVYINDTGSPRVTVKVTEVGGYAGTSVTSPLTGQITFNAETGHPPIVPATTKAIEVSNPFPENPFPENPFPENPFPENPFPENPFPENPFPENTAVQDVSWTVTSPTALSADTVAAYAALIGIDQAYWPYYGFQLIISKPSTTGVFKDCQSFNLPQGTIISNYFLPSLDPSNPFPENPFPENPFPENPFPENPFPENPFPENSAFTIAPSDSGSGTSSSTSSFSAFAATIGLTEAPPAVDVYKITLRVYQKPGIEGNPNFLRFEPKKNPPVVKVAEKNCVPGTPGCLTAESPSPELYIVVPNAPADPPTSAPDLGSVSPDPVPAGKAITLPDSPAVKNSKLKDNVELALAASDRSHGYYLVPSGCTLPTWGQVNGDTLPNCAVKIHEQTFIDPNTLAPGSSESLDTTVTVPFSTAPGTYRLLVYADRRRQVSESNEFNNWAVSQPFVVTPPEYGFLGLFSPCSGLTCEKSAGPAIPLAWQFTYDGVNAVDSQSTQPRLKIFRTSNASCDNPDQTPLFTADPTDISSGSSSWQYFGASCAPVGGTACVRPAYTWQYNWQTKDPATGANLAASCYLLKVEVPATNQVIEGKGPVASIKVTLR